MCVYVCVHARVRIPKYISQILCDNCMLWLCVTTACFDYVWQLHALIMCDNCMLWLCVTTACFDYVWQLHALTMCDNCMLWLCVTTACFDYVWQLHAFFATFSCVLTCIQSCVFMYTMYTCVYSMYIYMPLTGALIFTDPHMRAATHHDGIRWAEGKLYVCMYIRKCICMYVCTNYQTN